METINSGQWLVDGRHGSGGFPWKTAVFSRRGRADC